jgi:O-antigen ligase
MPFVIVATILIFLIESPGVVSENVFEYLRRGQSEQLFESMSGRTRAYDHAVVAFEDSPFFGRGQWTDRLVIYEHVHNSFLQSLLNAGIIGGIPYFASWIAGWVMFFKLRNKWKWLGREDRLCLLESGTVMMFFTVRAIPETTTASFAVDLLVMVAIYVYMETLTLEVARRQAASLLSSGFMVEPWPVVAPSSRLAQAFIQR